MTDPDRYASFTPSVPSAKSRTLGPWDRSPGRWTRRRIIDGAVVAEVWRDGDFIGAAADATLLGCENRGRWDWDDPHGEGWWSAINTVDVWLQAAGALYVS